MTALCNRSGAFIYRETAKTLRDKLEVEKGTPRDGMVAWLYNTRVLPYLLMLLHVDEVVVEYGMDDYAIHTTEEYKRAYYESFKAKKGT